MNWLKNLRNIEETEEEKAGIYVRMTAKLNVQAKNLTDINQHDIGIDFSNLTALYPTRKELKEDGTPIGQKRIYWYCECQDCGNYKYVLAAEFNKGQNKCICTKGKIDYSKSIKIGDVFGYLKVLDKTTSGILCECSCSFCKENSPYQNYFSANKLVTKHDVSCGRGATNSDANTVVAGDWFGYIEVISENFEKHSEVNMHRYWNCLCHKCNKMTLVRNDYFTHNGIETCSKCRQILSKGEQKIYDLLTNNNINFEMQKTFKNCKDKALLPFDFFANDKYIIEFDGGQHFKPVANWNFKSNRQHDIIKNKYCFENNIPLIRIPYDANYSIEDLRLETTRFLLTKDNEEEYYKLREK